MFPVAFARSRSKPEVTLLHYFLLYLIDFDFSFIPVKLKLTRTSVLREQN
jgi:hypothetical protein